MRLSKKRWAEMLAYCMYICTWNGRQVWMNSSHGLVKVLLLKTSLLPLRALLWCIFVYVSGLKIARALVQEPCLIDD